MVGICHSFLSNFTFFKKKLNINVGVKKYHIDEISYSKQGHVSISKSENRKYSVL